MFGKSSFFNKTILKAAAVIPIVAVTANAFDEDRKDAIEAGMNGHLAKPYDVPSIMATLKDLIGENGKE